MLASAASSSSSPQHTVTLLNQGSDNYKDKGHTSSQETEFCVMAFASTAVIRIRETLVLRQKERASTEKDRASAQKDKASAQKDKASAQKDRASAQKVEASAQKDRAGVQKDKASCDHEPICLSVVVVDPLVRLFSVSTATIANTHSTINSSGTTSTTTNNNNNNNNSSSSSSTANSTNDATNTTTTAGVSHTTDQPSSLSPPISSSSPPPTTTTTLTRRDVLFLGFSAVDLALYEIPLSTLTTLLKDKGLAHNNTHHNNHNDHHHDVSLATIKPLLHRTTLTRSRLRFTPYTFNYPL